MHDGPGSDAGEIGGGHHGDHHGGHHGPFGGWHSFAPIGDDGGVADGCHCGGEPHSSKLLPVGISSGWHYGKETFAHARTCGHLGSVIASVPRGTQLEARMAEVVALEAARKIGGVDKLAPYETSELLRHLLHSRLRKYAATGDGARQINLPGVARSSHTVELLVWPHGPCNPQQRMREVMKELGLSRIDLHKTGAYADIDKFHYDKLLPAQPFVGGEACDNPPNGWFHPTPAIHPHGSTTIWREFYQVKNFFQRWRHPDEDIFGGTHLASFGATWYHAHGDFYETRMAFSVHALSYLSQGGHTFKWERIRAHREAAEHAVRRLSSSLGAWC